MDTEARFAPTVHLMGREAGSEPSEPYATIRREGERRRLEQEALNPKDRAGAAKSPLELIPAGAVDEVAAVMAHGAAKYGKYNWRKTAITPSIYIGAALRHAFAMAGGEMIDRESKLPHAAHIAAGMMILLDAISVGSVKKEADAVEPKKADDPAKQS